LWDDNLPLKNYLYAVQQQKKIESYFSAWHAVAPVFSQYSMHLVKQHPTAFAHYFLWPNVKWYCLPPLESFTIYNTGVNTVDSTAIKWFRFKSEQVTSIDNTIQGTILKPLPYWFLLVNIVFCTTLAIVLFKAKKYSLPTGLFRTLLLAGGFWITNFCFSIYAAPIVLRFQLFPMIIYSTFSLVLINVIVTHRHHRSPSQ
jgi:hypothetical protein